MRIWCCAGSTAMPAGRSSSPSRQAWRWPTWRRWCWGRLPGPTKCLVSDVTGWDGRRPWYHGAQRRLARLRAGSSVTQDADVARAFSHRPGLVSAAGGRIRHDGAVDGYLYVVDEALMGDDVLPHPHPVNASRWEWLVQRDVRLRLVERTRVRPEDRLSSEEIAALRRRQQEVGQDTFEA